jgi:hypothetical protein
MINDKNRFEKRVKGLFHPYYITGTIEMYHKYLQERRIGEHRRQQQRRNFANTTRRNTGVRKKAPGVVQEQELTPTQTARRARIAAAVPTSSPTRTSPRLSSLQVGDIVEEGGNFNDDLKKLKDKVAKQDRENKSLKRELSVKKSSNQKQIDTAESTRRKANIAKRQKTMGSKKVVPVKSRPRKRPENIEDEDDSSEDERSERSDESERSNHPRILKLFDTFAYDSDEEDDDDRPYTNEQLQEIAEEEGKLMMALKTKQIEEGGMYEDYNTDRVEKWRKVPNHLAEFTTETVDDMGEETKLVNIVNHRWSRKEGSPPEFLIVYDTGKRIWSAKDVVVADAQPIVFYDYIDANDDIKGTTFDVREMREEFRAKQLEDKVMAERLGVTPVVSSVSYKLYGIIEQPSNTFSHEVQ